MIEQLKQYVIDVYEFEKYKTIIINALRHNMTKTQLNREKHNFSMYTEVHHILPKTLGGNDLPENLVLLSGQQHFLAHYHLFKATNNKKMGYAFNQMKRIIKKSDDSSVDYLSSLYEECRSDISSNLSKDQASRMKQLPEDLKTKIYNTQSTRMTGKVIVRVKNTDQFILIDKDHFNNEIHEYQMTGKQRPNEFKDRIRYTSSKEHRGNAFHNPETNEIRYFKEADAPEGFCLGNGLKNKHTKGTIFFHNPETKEQIRCQDGEQPDGWVKGRISFANIFNGTNIKKHIITGELSIVNDPPPLFVSPKCKGLYTYTDLNGIQKITGTITKITSDLNLDYAYFVSAMNDQSKVITHRTTSNNLHKTHKGLHIKNVYNIVFYERKNLTLELCNSLLKQFTWI